MDSTGSSETADTQRKDLMLFSGGLVAGAALSAIVRRVGAYSIEQALATTFLVIGLTSFALASKLFPGWAVVFRSKRSMPETFLYRFLGTRPNSRAHSYQDVRGEVCSCRRLMTKLKIGAQA